MLTGKRPRHQAALCEFCIRRFRFGVTPTAPQQTQMDNTKFSVCEFIKLKLVVEPTTRVFRKIYCPTYFILRVRTYIISVFSVVVDFEF